MKSFLLDYCTKACRAGILRLCFLFIDQTAIGMQICVEYARRLWVLKIGYDETCAKCSPGIQITKEAICYTFQNKLEAYEFLGSEESWLRPWTKNSHAYSTIVYYPFSRQGLSGFGRDVLRILLKKISN